MSTSAAYKTSESFYSQCVSERNHNERSIKEEAL